MAEAANDWEKSELEHISIETIVPKLRDWMNSVYAGLEPERVNHEWTDIDDWNQWVKGVSVNTYYSMPANVDFSTWVKVSTFKFRNTGYDDREYFYAPKNLIQDSS
jgi:hypothetical protein